MGAPNGRNRTLHPKRVPRSLDARRPDVAAAERSTLADAPVRHAYRRRCRDAAAPTPHPRPACGREGGTTHARVVSTPTKTADAPCRRAPRRWRGKERDPSTEEPRGGSVWSAVAPTRGCSRKPRHVGDSVRRLLASQRARLAATTGAAVPPPGWRGVPRATPPLSRHPSALRFWVQLAPCGRRPRSPPHTPSARVRAHGRPCAHTRRGTCRATRSPRCACSQHAPGLAGQPSELAMIDGGRVATPATRWASRQDPALLPYGKNFLDIQPP